jgi:tetratricopeptide repeat protein
MDHEQSVAAKVARLDTRGVAAINRNDYKLARQYFEQAYKLDPKNAFALNNMGYLAELDGDRETADFYYDKAREADQSSMKVAYASRKDVEGMKLSSVAGDSDDAVNKATEEAAALRRADGSPVVLRYRDNQPVMEPAVPPTPPAPAPSSPAPSGGGQLMQPLPDNQQPPASQPAPNQPPQGSGAANPNGGLLMPLPDNQQPSVAPEQNPPANQPNNASPDQQQQAPPPQSTAPQSQSAQPQNSQPANSNGGMLMPLPDNQQPPAAQSPQQ